MFHEDEFGVSDYGYRLLELDHIDGGDGIDTLEFQYSRNDETDIETLYLDDSIQNIERFVVSGLTYSWSSSTSSIRCHL